MKRHQLLVTISTCLLLFFYNLPLIEAHINPNPQEFAMAIDSLFADKADLKAPGASLIVMKGKETLLLKNYGSANLAFGLPFDENTIFPLEEFTEQLVIFSIFQLEKKKRIKINDAVNKYLPALGFENQVTLSHLVNHTSGLPNIGSLSQLAGWSFTDPFDQDDFLNLTKNFSSNLSPDKKIEHIHSGIKLLQLVVEKVSGVSFSEYATTHIFAPLKMTNTTIKAKDYSGHKNIAVRYEQTDAGYSKAIPNYTAEACPTTYSTQLDFQKWMYNYQSKLYEGDILDRMDETLTLKGKLQEKSYRDYLKGQHNYSSYLGQDEYYRTYTGNGFSWRWTRFKPSGVTIMAIGNLETYIGAKVDEIAKLLIDYDQPLSPEAKVAKAAPVELSKSEMEACTGIYWNEDYYFTTEISLKDGGVNFVDKDNGFDFQMSPRSKTFYSTPFGGTVEFTNMGGNQKVMKNILPNGLIFVSKQYDIAPLKEGDQLKYEGLYGSDKLKAFYRVVWENNKLILKRSRKPDLELTPIGEHQFRAAEVDFRVISFKDNENGSFQKMHISNTVVKNVEFGKL